MVYSDADLSSPIGLITTGRKIKIGNQLKKNGTLATVIVSGKVAFMKSSDLEIEDYKTHLESKKLKEHEYFDTEAQEIDDTLKNNNYVSLALHRFRAGDDWDRLATKANDNTGESIQAVVLSYEHRPKTHPYSWSIGLGLYTLSTSELQFRAVTLESMAHYIIYRSHYINLDIGGGLLLSADTRVASKVTQYEARGNMYGYQWGGQVKIMPESRLGGIVGLTFRKIKVVELNDIRLTENGANESLTSLSGTNLYAGLVYHF